MWISSTMEANDYSCCYSSDTAARNFISQYIFTILSHQIYLMHRFIFLFQSLLSIIQMWISLVWMAVQPFHLDMSMMITVTARSKKKLQSK